MPEPLSLLEVAGPIREILAFLHTHAAVEEHHVIYSRLMWDDVMRAAEELVQAMLAAGIELI